MSAMQAFATLGVIVICAAASIIATSSFIRGTAGPVTALTLAISSCLGSVLALPFGHHKLHWLPEVLAVVLGSAVLSAVLSTLCQIREQTKDR